MDLVTGVTRFGLSRKSDSTLRRVLVSSGWSNNVDHRTKVQYKLDIAQRPGESIWFGFTVSAISLDRSSITFYASLQGYPMDGRHHLAVEMGGIEAVALIPCVVVVWPMLVDG